MASLMLLLLVAGLSALLPMASGYMQCVGGPKAACECLLQCPVFGHNTARCENAETAADMDSLVDQVETESLSIAGNQCLGMMCIVTCTSKLECLNEAVKGRCQQMKDNNGSCAVSCEGLSTFRSASANFLG
mmetsp:Transcript_39682/g.127164  ORF Transcript_39682/g.127164 Transcript_39682/m.127164 type:complete len:132 (+) Transcript_39682:92-487(+)